MWWYRISMVGWKGLVKLCEIIVLRIPQTVDRQEYDFLTSCISKERGNKITGFVQKEDAYRSLFAELLARSMIIKKKGIQNRDIHFATNQYGKPFLMGEPNFKFNISHSGHWVVMIFGTEEVGIDIEEVKNIQLDIAKRYFAESEYLDIMSKSELERLEYFFRLWSLKECYIKAIGTGLSTPLNSFSIRILSKEQIVLCPGQSEYCFKEYNIDSRYKLSACSFRNPLPKSVQHYHYRNLVGDIMSNIGPI